MKYIVQLNRNWKLEQFNILQQKLIESYKNSTWLHIQKDRNYNINWIRSHQNCVRVWGNLLRNLFCLKFSYKILKLEKKIRKTPKIWNLKLLEPSEECGENFKRKEKKLSVKLKWSRKKYWMNEPLYARLVFQTTIKCVRLRHEESSKLKLIWAMKNIFIGEDLPLVRVHIISRSQTSIYLVWMNV